MYIVTCTHIFTYTYRHMIYIHVYVYIYFIHVYIYVYLCGIRVCATGNPGGHYKMLHHIASQLRDTLYVYIVV